MRSRNSRLQIVPIETYQKWQLLPFRNEPMEAGAALARGVRRIKHKEKSRPYSSRHVTVCFKEQVRLFCRGCDAVVLTSELRDGPNGPRTLCNRCVACFEVRGKKTF